jgi:hypothetical protein
MGGECCSALADWKGGAASSAAQESADVLLLAALDALVDLHCEAPIVDRIRRYFRHAEAIAASDNNDVDLSRPN